MEVFRLDTAVDTGSTDVGGCCCSPADCSNWCCASSISSCSSGAKDASVPAKLAVEPCVARLVRKDEMAMVLLLLILLLLCLVVAPKEPENIERFVDLECNAEPRR